jgi:hypothetical protein
MHAGIVVFDQSLVLFMRAFLSHVALVYELVLLPGPTNYGVCRLVRNATPPRWLEEKILYLGLLYRRPAFFQPDALFPG